jgi:hypothetical protein
MQPGTAERLRGWAARPVPDGYAGLHELAAAGFSGAVSGGGAWLFMLNGNAVAVGDGSLDAFDGATTTAYEAPDDALPLLFAMRERGGEKRGQYYTERTALSEVHGTLSEGGFTGYVELSENVLSGDYYAVYYGGNAMYAAFVGESERLLTGSEAEEKAHDEVGLYDVVAVDLSVLDLPDPPADASTGAAGGAAGGGAGAAAGDASPTASEAGASPATDEPPGVDEDASEDDQRPVRADAGGEEAGAASERAGSGGDLDLESTLGGERSTADADDPVDAPADAAPEERPSDDASTPARPEDATAGADPDTTAGDSPGTVPDESEGDSTDEAVAASLEEVALDESPDPPADEGRATAAVTETDRAPSVPDTGGDRRSAPEAPASEPAAGADGTELDDVFDDADERGVAEEASQATAAPTAGTDDAGEDADGERADLEARVAALRAERERLAEERDRLRERVDELEAEAAADRPPADAERVEPRAALGATDLFVRYRSKGAETLEAAHDGADNREAVRGNLDLEHHTRFDAASTVVDGDPFEAFLSGTLEHELVTWLVADLLYEIRDTGHVDGLRPLYDALPRIDRADLYGAVEVGEGADGDEERVAFDVVCRDRLGAPVVCLDVHDSREPATDAEMEAVVEKSARVAEVHDDFACAFLVTSSFFDPSAMALATERTASGGLFGGGSRESFVKLSRKRGYHLCLVEARERRFHLTMPEL